MPESRRVLIWGRPHPGESRSADRLAALKAQFEPKGVVFEDLPFTKDRNEAIKILQDRQGNGPAEALRQHP
jgi:hypothetical protein